MARRKSLVHEHGKGNKPQPACSGHRQRRRGCPFWSRRIRRPQSSCASRICTAVSEQENISHPLLSSTPPVFQYGCKVNVGSISGCTFQIFHGYVRIVQNERKRRIVIESDEDDWRLSYFLSTLSSFELIFTASNFDFHFTLTYPYFLINKILFDRQKTLSRIFESAITFVRCHYKAFLFKLILDDFTFNKFVFWTCISLLLTELLASSKIHHGGSPLSASHRKCMLLSETIKSRVPYN